MEGQGKLTRVTMYFKPDDDEFVKTLMEATDDFSPRPALVLIEQGYTMVGIQDEEDDNEEGVETHLNAVSPVSVTATEDTVAAQDMFLDEEEVQPKTAQAPVQDMQSECHVSSGPDDMQPGQLDGPSMDPGTPELQEPAIPSAKHLETPPMDVNRFVCAKGRRFRPAKHHKHHKDEVLGHISCAGSVMVLAGIAPSSVVVG